MNDLMPIGRFADAARLSLKALRLYDEQGLLPPARVDSATGYRSYRPEQLETATTIRLLRACGMPLAEIRAFLAAPSDVTLVEFERALTDELAERRRILRYLRRRLKEAPMFDVRTKTVEEIRFVSRTKRVRVPELSDFICRTVSELRAEHEPSGPDFVLYHGEVNEEADGPVEVCLPTRAGDKRLPQGEVAFTVAVGEETEFPQILGAYEAVAKWVHGQGREPSGPPREINDFAEGETPRMEIAFPLR
jgi:DNA-binding transcriptional MerR regulator